MMSLLTVYKLLDEIREKVAGVERVSFFVSGTDYDIRQAICIQVDTMDDLHMRETILLDELLNIEGPELAQRIFEYRIETFNRRFDDARESAA